MFKNKNKTRSIKMSGQLRTFFMWPVYIGIVLVFLNISMFFISVKAAVVMCGFMAAYILICIFVLLYLKPGIMRDMIEFSSNYSQVQRQLLYDMSVPYCLVDNSGRVMWMNKAMMEKTNKKRDFKKNISDIFPEITANVFPDNTQAKEVRISYQ